MAEGARASTVLAPIAMGLPAWRATLRVGAPELARNTQRAWRASVTNALFRLPQVRRVAVLDLAPALAALSPTARVLVLEVFPFEAVERALGAARGIATPEGGSCEAIALGAATLSASGPDVERTPNLAGTLACDAALEDAITRA